MAEVVGFDDADGVKTENFRIVFKLTLLCC